MAGRNKMSHTRTIEDVLITNWAMYTCARFRVHNSVLITGANESGKSTAIDALVYAMFGITDFNIQAGAGSDERSVASYVRGDTKDNEERFLRGDQDVTSYIAVDVHDPEKDSWLTEGVCIELFRKETKPVSRWFVIPDARIDDINFYIRKGSSITMTPRQDLRCHGKKIEFLRQQEGIAAFLRQCGLRLPQNGVRELQGKIKRLLGCGKKRMDIDRFVRESVFEEDTSAGVSLQNILRHKEEYAQLLADMRALNEEKKLLLAIEDRHTKYMTLDTELLRWNLVISEYAYMHRRQENEALQKRMADTREQIVILEQQEADLNRRYKKAEEAYADVVAETRGQQDPINRLKAALSELEEEKSACEDSILALRGLKEQLNQVFSDQEDVSLPEETAMVLRDAAGNSWSEEEIVAAMQRTEQARVSLLEKLQQKKDDLNYQIHLVRDQLDQKNKEIRLLQQNKRLLPRGMEEDLKHLRTEMEQRGVTAEVRILADLVNEIDPKWQLAAETFLGNRRFDLIVAPEAVPALRDIIDECDLHSLYLVLTNRMDDISDQPPEGSLAAKFRIANLYARKFINFVCGPLKCVETREELNDNPRGAILPDGMMAVGMVAHKPQPVRYLAIGRDAAERMLEQKKEERGELNRQLEELQAAGTVALRRYSAAERVSFSPSHYDVTAPKTLVRIDSDLTRTRQQIEEMEKAPSIAKLLDQMTEKQQERDRISAKVKELYSRKGVLQDRVQQDETAYGEGQQEEKVLREAYERDCAAHQELVKSAEAIYETQKNNAGKSVRHHVTDLQSELQAAGDTLMGAMYQYSTVHQGFTPSVTHVKPFIDRLNDLRNKDIENLQNKIAAKGKTISDTFMRDFVEVIYSRIGSMKDQARAINQMLAKRQFGDRTYALSLQPRSNTEMKDFFQIAKKIDELGGCDSLEMYLSMNSSLLEQEGIGDAFGEFRDAVLNAEDISEYTDYRNYYDYDILIRSNGNSAYLSKAQGIYSGGGRQTPYFILLTAALMTSYGTDTCCIRPAFIDEAFAAMDSMRIHSMIDYFDDNGLQVFYAAPPDKGMTNISPYVDTNLAVVRQGRQAVIIDALSGLDDMQQV